MVVLFGALSVDPTQWYRPAMFGTICPKAPHPQAGLLPDTAKEVFLPHMPEAFLFEEVQGTPDLRFVGTCEDRLVLVSDSLHEPRSRACH